MQFLSVKPSLSGKIFRVKVKVQVFDAINSIWEIAVILSLISDWCVKIKWSNWPESAIFSVSEDRKENATAWNIRKFTNTMILVSSAEGGIRKKIKYSSTPDGCRGTRWSFLNMLDCYHQRPFRVPVNRSFGRQTSGYCGQWTIMQWQFIR